MTTGRINQVFTKVTVKRRRHGIHAHKPPATRNNFPTTVVETKAAKRQPAPASTHKQPTTRQQGMVKTTPAPKKQARTKYSQEGKNPSKYLKTAPENQSSQAEAAHTIEQEAPM